MALSSPYGKNAMLRGVSPVSPANPHVSCSITGPVAPLTIGIGEVHGGFPGG